MLRSLIYNTAKLLLILILPFCILIRGAVYLNFAEGINAMLALSASAFFTAILLVIYFSFVYGKLTKKKTKIKYIRRRFVISFLLVGGFVLYGIVFLSSSNTKSSQVKSEFHNLHPILRLGCSTLFMLDRKAIMTDASRVPEDYARMGLKSKSNSLHYKQKDGYAYAIDLRTKNRFEVRNQALRLYFYLMGFKTLRHGGTADHLHVSMPCRYHPYAK